VRSRPDVDGEPLCGESLDGEMWPIGECCLRKGHLGDHYAVVTWPRYEPRPPGPPTAMSQLITKIWGSTIEQALAIKPVLGASAVLPRGD
jgi:hypothetical protein